MDENFSDTDPVNLVRQLDADPISERVDATRVFSPLMKGGRYRYEP
jgi:hypothetical protein